MKIRAAVPADAMAVARVHVRSWQAAYRGLLADEYLDGLRAEDRAKMYDFASDDAEKPRTMVAEDGGVVIGFVTWMPTREKDLAGYGEVCALYVAPEQWGRGVGAALILEARAQLYERGLRQAVLWILKGNVRGERFYRGDGWVADGVSKRDVMWGVEVEELRYRRELEGERGVSLR